MVTIEPNMANGAKFLWRNGPLIVGAGLLLYGCLAGVLGVPAIFIEGTSGVVSNEGAQKLPPLPAEVQPTGQVGGIQIGTTIYTFTDVEWGFFGDEGNFKNGTKVIGAFECPANRLTRAICKENGYTAGYGKYEVTLQTLGAHATIERGVDWYSLNQTEFEGVVDEENKKIYRRAPEQ